MKSLLVAVAMNHCKSMKGQEGNSATEKLDAKEHREFRSGAGICQYMTEQRFDIHCFQYEGNHERRSRTDQSFKDKIEENRALPQRTSAMCTEFPLGGKAGRRHPCDRGCRLGWHDRSKLNSGRTAAAPNPSCKGLDQDAEQNNWRCRRCGFNS